ncbi:MAG: hypothetical protein ACK5NT_14270 [Pyrinomonadaceae bacterium]
MNKGGHFTLLFVFSLILLGLSGCKSLGIGGSKLASMSPDEAVKSSFKDLNKQKSYHSEITSKIGDRSLTTKADYQSPDKFYVVNKIGDTTNEVIVIGNDTFSRMNEGDWTKASEGASPNVKKLRDELSAKAEKSMSDVKAVGTETVDGKATHVYTFKSNEGGSSDSKIWLLDDSGLPLKVESKGNYSGQEVNVVISYDYNAKVDISKPEVKEQK